LDRGHALTQEIDPITPRPEFNVPVEIGISLLSDAPLTALRAIEKMSRNRQFRIRKTMK